MTTLSIAYSPCPNDTFVFHAWAHGLIEGAPSLDVTFADIDLTNGWLESHEYDLLKISAAALPAAQAAGYQLVPAGGAVGRGCGPLLLSASPTTEPAGLRGATLAIPSEQSTAYRVARRWIAANVPSGVGTIVVMPFVEIMPAVAAGKVDAGLVIHEARFTYADYGLHNIVDLGDWWETQTGLPLALGAIVARDDIVESYGIAAITDWTSRSVQHAWTHPEDSREYVAEHADEMSPEVQRAHIALYVNDFTRDLGVEGLEAFDALLTD